MRDWGIIKFDGVPSAISRTIDSLVPEGRGGRSSFAPGSAEDLRRKIRGSIAICATPAMQIDRKSRGENRRFIRCDRAVRIRGFLLDVSLESVSQQQQQQHPSLHQQHFLRVLRSRF
jgi:hypothetical protein